MPRVLVIEDEHAILEEVLDWLKFEGFESKGAPDGKQGVEIAQTWHPELIVSDITMPEMDGYQVILELRKDPKTALIPLIFLTARADRSFMRHGMELGADDYVTKPFTRAELLSSIRSRLSRTQKIAEIHESELEDAKTKLTRLVAHELRTPLSSVRVVKDIIERQLDQLDHDEIKDLMGTLGSGTERLHHLIEQMVYLTYLETGKLSHAAVFERPVVTYMWQVMPAIVDLARRFTYRNRDLSVDLEVRDSEASIIADIPALKHSIAEIISNAINFSPKDGIVSVKEWKADGSVWISVADTGKGMSAEDQKKALEPFTQINREKVEQQGIGLGLTIAKRIVEIHGGELTIHSQEGKGTQVSMRFPAV